MSAQAVRALPALYAVSALAGLAAGLFNPLSSTLLAAQGASQTAIGAVQSLFFGGVLLGAPLARLLMRRRGARATIALGLLLSVLAALALPGAPGWAAWCAVRLVMGVGLGLYMVGGQCGLAALSPEARRAGISALHGLAFGIGLGIGPLVGVPLYGIDPWLAFAAGAATLALGLPLVALALPPLRLQAAAPRYALLPRLSVPLHAVFAYGVAEASLLTLFPVFLLQREGAEAQALGGVGITFAAFVVGGLVGTLPLARLADRRGREPVLLGCALAGAASALALVFVHDSVWLALLALAAGASLGPVYALALALVGQRLGGDDVGAGSALFTAAFSAGAMAAPWLSALLMQHFGAAHVFTLTAVLFGSLALRLLARAPVPAAAELHR